MICIQENALYQRVQSLNSTMDNVGDTYEIMQLKIGVIKMHVIICLLGIIHFGVWDSLG